MKRIFEELKNWSKGEIIFYSIVLLFAILVNSIAGAKLDFKITYILLGVFIVIAYILAIKKTLIGYILSIVAMVLYSIVAYKQAFYSEVMICGIFLFPYICTEIFKWFKPTKEVQLKGKKAFWTELSIVVVAMVVFFFGAYNLFNIIENKWAIGSAFALCFAALGIYFTTYNQRYLAPIMMLVSFGLSCTCWILLAIYVNISYAAIAIGYLAVVIAMIGKIVINIKHPVRQ